MDYCCFHIGLPKTATKTLQDFLFAHHSQVQYLGRYHVREKRRFGQYANSEIQELVQQLCGRSSLFHPDFTRCREIFDKDVRPVIANGRRPVLSWEVMSLQSARVRRARARNMKEVFGNCRIAITIRQPVDLAESAYFQYLFRKLIGSESHFGAPLPTLDIERWLRSTWSRLNHLDYAETIGIFADVFGKDAVGVFLFEKLREDNEAFVRDLSSFLGIDPEESVRLTSEVHSHPRFSGKQMGLIEQILSSRWLSLRFQFCSRRARRLWLAGQTAERGRSMLDANDGPRARASLSDASTERIVERTREGNRWLKEEWGLPLDRYSYPLGSGFRARSRTTQP